VCKEQENKLCELQAEIAEMEKKYQDQKSDIENMEQSIHDDAKENVCIFNDVRDTEENTVPQLMKEEALNQQCIEQQLEEIKKHEQQGAKLRG